MTIKFSEDIVPLTDLKANEFEAAEEARAFMRAVVEGLSDIEEGRKLDLRDVKARLRVL